MLVVIWRLFWWKYSIGVGGGGGGTGGGNYGSFDGGGAGGGSIFVEILVYL